MACRQHAHKPSASACRAESEAAADTIAACHTPLRLQGATRLDSAEGKGSGKVPPRKVARHSDEMQKMMEDQHGQEDTPFLSADAGQESKKDSAAKKRSSQVGRPPLFECMMAGG